MGYLEYSERVTLRSPSMLIAFAGWSDAAEGATGALKYLVRKFPAQRLASIDPEEFYDFTQARPTTRVDAQGQREITWPASTFYYYHDVEQEQDMLIFVGVEPNLKWRTYANLVADVAQEHGVERAVMLGALLDAVPHTRPVKLSGGAGNPALISKLEAMGIRASAYQGPTGISSAVSQAFQGRGIPFGSMWAHSPHYIQVETYPKTSLALLEKVEEMMDRRFDLQELRSTQASFDKQFQQLLQKEEDVMAYVQRLERQYDASTHDQAPIPTPQEMVKELEDFLRHRSEGTEEGPGPRA